MELHLTNTLTRKKQEFHPIHPGKVGLYVCGPTVYNIASIGNFRSFIFADVLRRTLELNGYEVRHVMNITDVGHLVGDGDDGEDKMMLAMRREGKSAWEIAEYYTDIFLKDIKRLNLRDPHTMPRATDHIKEQIEMVEEIEKNGYAYKTSDGIYFDTAKLPGYGVLAGQSQEDKEAGARVQVNPEKRNPADFALWKFSPQDQKRDMEWESPWGMGFPGWHIECSAMSEKYLDSPFDIHTGGEDHITTHHPNEIAQTEAARGHTLAKWWLHGAFLKVDGGKMSKSKQNIYTLDQVIERGAEALALRYFYLSAHYRSSLNFTWESVGAAQNALNHLRNAIWGMGSVSGDVHIESMEAFRSALNNDLDTPGALAVLWDMLKDASIPNSEKRATILKMDAVLGLDLHVTAQNAGEIPQEVQDLMNKRKEAREAKDWTRSDEIREQIEALGFDLLDTAHGAEVRPRYSAS